MTHRAPKKSGRPPAGLAFTVDRPAGLLEFLLAHLKDKSRSKIKSLLAHRRVLVDGAAVTRFDHPLQPGQTVSLGPGAAAGEPLPRGLKIVYEDSSLIVVDKPTGLLSVATETEKDDTAYRALDRRVKRESPGSRIFIVHRLDREASGLMMFAKNQQVKKTLRGDWRGIVHERVYAAVVEGRVEKPEGTIKSCIRENKAMTMRTVSGGEGAKWAVTHYQVLKRTASYSLLHVELDTGRKNQIRVHMKEMGHSLVGDKKYGAKTNPIKRLGLHAHKLGFTHPVTKEKLEFTSPLPGSFKALFHK